MQSLETIWFQVLAPTPRCKIIIDLQKLTKNSFFFLFEKHFMDVLWFSSMQQATTSNTLLKTKKYFHFQSVLPILFEYVKQKWKRYQLLFKEDIV